MKLIRPKRSSYNLEFALADHHLSWRAKGLYAQLLALPNHAPIDLIELSTHASDGIQTLKAGLTELQKFHYLVINNKLLIIKSSKKGQHSLTTKNREESIITRHETHVTNELLRNQWLIIWHRDDARVTKALSKLAHYLNPAMVLYGIQYSKQHCHSYRESLPYLNRLIMKWKQQHLTSVGQTQRWMNQRKLKSKPWNSETQNRIFSSRRRTMINNTPLRNRIPDVFKKHRK